MHVVGKANLSARSDTQDSQSPDVSNCILRIRSTRLGAIGSRTFTKVPYKGRK